ncbi:MAG: Rpn family recombination-promoting nuclease/putative transposase [Prevotellaceae bacterium]|jgi:predicted transposase/invertase (TIGR01784 family)|nr:Rpn family recombination-promoting nuclease/putative transposase [Prevotellaceae bacterium]
MAQKKGKGKKAKNSGARVFMNPKTDFGFKKIFGNKLLMMKFLTALGVLPEEIAAIEYLPLEQLGVVKENRKAIYDIYVKTASGKRYIVEMQVSGQDHFVERMLFYASYSVIYQAPKGKVAAPNAKGKKVEKQSYDIAGVYVIAILDFVLFKEKTAKDIVVEQVKLMRQEANMEFTDKYRFLIIELPKFKKALEELSTLEDKLLFSLKNMDKLSERPEVMSEEVFTLLYEEARINKLTEVEMETYNKSILEYDDVRQAVDFAKREGLLEGQRKGIKQERIRLVKRLRLSNMSIKQIAKMTGLTEERIYNILDS